MSIRLKSLALLLITLFAFTAVRAQDDEAIKQRVIQIAADSDMFSDWLPSHPNYQSNASGPDDNGVWYVEFKSESDDEWLGYANVNADTGEIQDAFAPKPLSTDVYQEQLPQVTAFALADAEVLARLNNNPKLWDMYPDWNRWDATWDVGFLRGIDGIVVKLKFDDNQDLYIEKIVDPNALSDDEKADKAHDDAINLAYGAEGLGEALNGHDRWSTYVEAQGENRWSVSFVDGEDILSIVVVDTKTGKILKTKINRP